MNNDKIREAFEAYEMQEVNSETEVLDDEIRAESDCCDCAFGCFC